MRYCFSFAPLHVELEMQINYKPSNYFAFFSHTAIAINFGVWLKVLARNRFAVGFAFLPKALVITFMSLLNLPFAWIETLLYNKKIKATKVVAPIFILGHPRSGTTFLQYVLSRDPRLAYCTTADALAPNTMLLLGKYFTKMLAAFMPETRPQDNVRMLATTPKEEEFALANLTIASNVQGFYFPQNLQQIFKDFVLFKGDEKNEVRWKNGMLFFMKKLTVKNNGKRLVMKSPWNTGRVKEIKELFPDAIFIHIHRDPYEVYQSTTKLFQSVLPILSLQKPNGEKLDEFLLNSYAAMHNKFLAEKHEVDESRFCEFGYRQFISNPMAELESIYKQLKIKGFQDAKPYFEEELKHFDGYKTNRHPNLPAETIKSINENWGFFFEAYGYKMHET